MFNNLILKYFDLLNWGGSYVVPKPIFNQSVKNTFGIILNELILVAAGDRPAEDYPVAIQKFSKYLTEAKKSLKAGVSNDLLNMSASSFEKECGARIACFIEAGVRSGAKEYLGEYVINQFDKWVDNPKKNNQTQILFDWLIIFNKELTDAQAREVFDI